MHATSKERTLTFARGGVHPPERKELTRSLPIETFPAPEVAEVLMVQHIGAPARPVVKKGDEVKKGQLVGQAQGFVSAHVHAPVSGKVRAVEPRVHTVTGLHVAAVIIENDGQETWADGLGEPQDAAAMDPRQMVDLVQQAGVVGLGGAAFPTHVKLSPPPNMTITDVFINGTECEPFVTCDHRLMLERTGDIIEALRLIMRIVNAPQGHVGIEENKPDAIEAFRACVNGNSHVAVHALKTRYPQGAEQQLIKAATGREVPDQGGLPHDVGCLVQNVGTALAIRDAVLFRRPLTERAITVTGEGVEKPANLLVRVGTPVTDVLERQGIRDGVTMAILGGPMMGIAQSSLNVPILKGNNAILLVKKEPLSPQRSCIRCGRCVEHCPLGLVPSDISIACESLDWDAALEAGIMECKECGCCAYVCPANRRIVHQIKFGKAELAKRKKRQTSDIRH